MQNTLEKALTFHYNATEQFTDKPPSNNGITFEAYIQIEWDCADDDVNRIMENDIRPVVLGESIQEKNLLWIHTIKRIACEKLNLSGANESYLFISLHKVMDGIVNCYVTHNHSIAYIEQFDMVVENTGYLRMTYCVPYHTTGRPYVSLRGKCMYNDSIEEGYVA